MPDPHLLHRFSYSPCGIFELLCILRQEQMAMATIRSLASKGRVGLQNSLDKHVYTKGLDEHIWSLLGSDPRKHPKTWWSWHSKKNITIQSLLDAGSACFFVTRRSNPFDGGKGEVTACFCCGVFKTLGAAAGPGLAAGEGLAARSAFNLSRRSFAAWDAGGWSIIYIMSTNWPL